MLHWNRAYRDLMAHPAVVPILEQLCGARFRLDHINVHTHVAAGYSGSSLHGGSNPGGGNGFYHYQGGQMRNGLVAVTWELEDTHCNGGGFCCIPVSARATSDSLSLSLWILTAARERTGYAQERPRDGAGLARQPPAAGEGYGRRLREHRHGPSECARGLLPTRRRNHFHRAPQGPTAPLSPAAVTIMEHDDPTSKRVAWSELICRHGRRR